jgi:hypothetical protein
MDDPQYLPEEPVFPKEITAESIAEYKAQCRVWDAARIKFGVATPEQVQRENSAVGSMCGARIVHRGRHG